MANNTAVLSQMLCDAALENDVSALSDLLSKDPFLLGRSNTTSSCSPLHIACKEGCLEFVKELLKRRPLLSEDLDSNKSSPLHIASQNGHSELIQPLVEAKPSMCFSRDMMGMTPFHLAAMNGYLPVLEKLLSFMPVAAKERVGGVGADTVLHLCVKFNQLHALKAVIEKVGDAEFLNAKDGDGNSILHLAVANNQLEILEELLKEKRLKKNSSNSNGWAAADIHILSNKDRLKDDNKDEPKDKKSDEPKDKKSDEPNLDDKDDKVREMLEKAGAFPSTDVTRDTETDMYLSWFESKRSALIVAASLIATVAFQAGINPPGGVWQDTQLGNSTTTATANQTTTHIAGLAILAHQVGATYNNFLILNTFCLVSAISSMVLLIFPLPPRRKLLRTITFLLYLTLIYLTAAYSIAVYSMIYGQRKSRVGSLLIVVLPLLGTFAIVSCIGFYVSKWPRDGEVSVRSTVSESVLSMLVSTGRRR